jgi:hypothetical protein
MRKIIIMMALAVSGLFLASMASPSVKPVTTSATAAVYNDTLNWKQLAEIKYLKKPSKDYPEGVMFPVINTKLKAKQSKTIVMSGFVIPIDHAFFVGRQGRKPLWASSLKTRGKSLRPIPM